MRSIWTGAPGRWLFRAAAWRFKAMAPGAGLDSALQKKLPSLRGTVERLVERQAAAERRIAELGAALSMTGQTPVGQDVLADERAALAAEIEGARRQAMEERTRAIEVATPEKIQHDPPCDDHQPGVETAAWILAVSSEPAGVVGPKLLQEMGVAVHDPVVLTGQRPDGMKQQRTETVHEATKRQDLRTGSGG